MKNLIAALMFALFGAFTAQAAIIDTITASGTGRLHRVRDPVFVVNSWQSNLAGTHFNGQSLQYDIVFNNFFVRTFTETQRHPLLVDMFLPYRPFWTGVNPPPNAPSLSGTATFLNADGQTIGGAFDLNFALDGGPGFEPDVQLWFLPRLGKLPLDIYGIQFDLSLSDTPDAFFSNDPTPNAMLFAGLFATGPGHIPHDVVPDSGTTLGLLFLGLTGLWIVRTFLLTLSPKPPLAQPLIE
jgi:VPDSG-CTERM motif